MIMPRRKRPRFRIADRAFAPLEQRQIAPAASRRFAIVARKIPAVGCMPATRAAGPLVWEKFVAVKRKPMTLHPAVRLAALALLAGCAGMGYQTGDSYAHTQALATMSDPDAQLVLARMYADPAAWPQMQARQQDPVQAAKWCLVYQRQGRPARPDTLAQGPSCEQIVARLPADAVSVGQWLALQYTEGTWYRY
jgi:hypothetical protein